MSTVKDEQNAVKYDRKAARSKTIAKRHTRLAVEGAARGDAEGSHAEIARGRVAWDAVRAARRRAASLRAR